MGLFSFDRSKSSARPSRKARTARRTSLSLETLEDRLTPSGNSISGFVYADANNNGIFDPGETAIANTTVTLKNSANQVVGVTTTDANGHYIFSTDQTISTTPKTMTQTVSFGPTDTDFDLTSTVNQFDPSLGQLTEVDIEHDGSIVSAIKVENTSK
ncbi:MAG TPA: SdrD B-like domain-containing protein, partial [Gemmataceae bacterium]|nr:SdrD B-like domain-containing protein [Gemmataceae bacterium]